MPGPKRRSSPDVSTAGESPVSPSVEAARTPDVAGGKSSPLERTATSASHGGGEPARAALSRAATIITLGNLISRASGFVRVLAVAGALGIAFLGDAYQRANEVSNVLFELLIGGLLFSILVPSFVELLTAQPESGTVDSADVGVGAPAEEVADQFTAGTTRSETNRIDPGPEGARHLGSVLATRGSVFVGGLALIGMFGGKWVMRLLTLGVPDDVRNAQIRIGAFLLWFVMPQLVFYAAGSVANALLQADHRFLATSIAPLFNNIVVTVTMVVFAANHDPSRGLALTAGEKILLGAGTLAGTVAMTVVPFVALWKAGLSLRPRWRTRGYSLETLVRRGAWAAGHVGLNEVLILVTIVLAGRVDGGVIAYQTAFMFFLLPHALLAYPIFTALFPRLSRKAAQEDSEGFAADLTLGARSMLLMLVPASGLLAVAAAPALTVVHIGRLDAAGVALVSEVLAGYLVGLTAYSMFFLLTRAAYALGDARSPTVVNFAVTFISVVAMFAAVAFTHGSALLIAFGVIQAVTLLFGSIVLFGIVRRQIGQPVPIVGALWRSVGAATPAVGLGLVVAVTIGWSSRGVAVVSGSVATLAGIGFYVFALWCLRTPELLSARDRLRSRFESGLLGGAGG